MLRILAISSLTVLTLGAVTGTSFGQPENDRAAEIEFTKKLLEKATAEYKNFFKKPEKPLEFWAAMKFEIDLGKYDLAGLHMLQLLQQPPDKLKKTLVQIEAAEGMSTFLRLRKVKKWSEYKKFDEERKKDVETLIDLVTKSVEEHLSDPQRLAKFINNLDAPTIEERAYALVQLDRSGARAVPHMVAALNENVGKQLYSRITEALTKMRSEAVPPLLEILKAANPADAADTTLRPTVLRILRVRGDQRAVPYLWHLSSSKLYPEPVRQQAANLLADLTNVKTIKDLPPSKIVLTDMSEKHFAGKVKFEDPNRVELWPWDGRNVSIKPIVITPAQAEFIFGIRYAKQALDLDPSYRPAQRAFLSFTIERAVLPAIEKYLFEETKPKSEVADVQRLLSTIDADLLLSMLERGFQKEHVPIILGCVQALGKRGEMRAARPNTGGRISGVVRALYYPDRRVQFAAIQAMLQMPADKNPVATTRIVELLGRFVASEGKPKAMVLFAPQGDAAKLRMSLADAGFAAFLADSIKDAMRELGRTADYDFILLHHAAPSSQLPFVLTQFRKDNNVGRLPLLITSDKENEGRLIRLAAKYPQTTVIPEALVTLPKEFKSTIKQRIDDATGFALTDVERSKLTSQSLDLLWRMARGEIRGYDVLPVVDAIMAAIPRKGLALQAIEILGRLPGAKHQQRLADVVLDKSRDKLRTSAAIELNRHVQKHGLQLDRRRLLDLRDTYRNASENPALRNQLAVVMGKLKPDASTTGTRLLEFPK